MLRNKLLYSLILLCLSYNIHAQEVSFTAESEKNVSTGERFVIQYKLITSQQGKNVNLPTVAGLEVLNVRSSSFSQTTIINGHVSNTLTYVWYQSVVARKKGTIRIPAASVIVAGNKYKSNKLTINVSKGSAVPESSDRQLPNKDIFLNLTTNKQDVYIGEPIYIYIKLFSKYHLNMNSFTPSNMDNFWIKELPMPSSVKSNYTNLNGVQYLTAVLEKKVIFAQKTGKLTIAPYKAEFQLYNSLGYPVDTKNVISNSKYINVKPLPANKPESFTGAVGEFDISVTADAYEVETDKPIIISLKIKGLGNTGLFDVPKINIPKTFEELIPETKTNLQTTTQGISGSKTYIYKYIPRVPGNYTIPGVKFSYFNPQIKKYQTKISDTLNITVIGDSSVSYNGAVARTNVSELSEDIRFINTANTKLSTKNNYLFGNFKFWLAYLIPTLIFALVIIILRKKIKQNANIELVKSKKADKISAKKLKIAEKHLKQGDLEIFYEEITKALWGYLSDKLSIPHGKLVRQTAIEILKKYNLEDSLINNFIDIIDKSEIGRYAPKASNFTPEEIYSSASKLIVKFEKQIQITKK